MAKQQPEQNKDTRKEQPSPVSEPTYPDVIRLDETTYIMPMVIFDPPLPLGSKDKAGR
jgi:hypothetical protein